MDRPDLAEDERFVGATAQAANADALRAALTETFAAKPLEHWRTVFAQLPFPWAPALTPAEAADDAQSIANDYVREVEVADGEPVRFLTGPLQLDEQPPAIRRAPLHGEHTDEILLEMGFDWDAIIELKIANAVL
jgi:crotonobetainyl-CoA:carnitine CoA-transferase CaiB-like acyl-CoA transferase